jgi:predicted Zn-dependent protease
MDLLTVLRHELGHVLGLDHDAPVDVMAETLEVGERLAP